MDRILIITLLDEGVVISNAHSSLGSYYTPEKSQEILNDIITKLAEPNYVIITPVPVEIRDLRNKRIIT